MIGELALVVAAGGAISSLAGTVWSWLRRRSDRTISLSVDHGDGKIMTVEFNAANMDREKIEKVLRRALTEEEMKQEPSDRQPPKEP